MVPRFAMLRGMYECMYRIVHRISMSPFSRLRYYHNTCCTNSSGSRDRSPRVRPRNPKQSMETLFHPKTMSSLESIGDLVVLLQSYSREMAEKDSSLRVDTSSPTQNPRGLVPNFDCHVKRRAHTMVICCGTYM